MHIRTVVATFGKFWKIEILVISNSNQTKFAKYIVWRNKVLNNGSPKKKKVLNNAQISEKIIMLIKMRLIMLFENIFFYKMIIYY